MRNEIKKTLSLGALCTMAFFTANSAFAADYPLGGSYGKITTDTTNESYYTYENWTTDTVDTYTNESNVTCDNLTIGAGSTYTFSSVKTLTVSNIYLYGNTEANAQFTEKNASTQVTVSGNMILNYGTFTQSGDCTLSVAGDIEMYGASKLTIAAGDLTVVNFYVGDSSTVSTNGTTSNTASPSIGVSGTLTLADDASFSMTATNASTTSLIIKAGGSFKIQDNASFTKTTGTLTFQSGTSLVVSGGSFSSNTTTMNGTGTISLILDSIDLSGDAAEATILGSLNLGTVTFGSGADWTIKLDVSSVLDTYYEDFSLELSELITISTTSNLDIVLVDADGNAYSDYTASLSGTTVSFTYAGTAVPEPSTYAMIFGVVALGFAAYRRRK